MVNDGSTTFRVTAVIVAGGSGKRMGGDVPKQYLPLAGAPVLAWTATAFERAHIVDEIVLVVPEDDLSYVAAAIVDAYHLHKVRRIVAGGPTRQASMLAGLAVIGDTQDIVLVHDGARPFVSPRIIAETAECAAGHGSALVAVPVTDTIKRANKRREAVETIPREGLWAAQTPQGFRVPLLRRAASKAQAEGYEATDEALLVERLGLPVPIVPGEQDNMKITTPDDLVRARAIAERRDPP